MQPININDSIEYAALARREAKITETPEPAASVATAVANKVISSSGAHPWFKKAGIRPNPELVEAAGPDPVRIRDLSEVNGDIYTLTEFQDHALQMARYPGQGNLNGLVYTVLALCGEAGELANKLKKHLRDGQGKPVNENELADELSDVLWYVAAASRELNRNLGDLAIFNIEKLRNRAAENEKADLLRKLWLQLQEGAQPIQATVLPPSVVAHTCGPEVPSNLKDDDFLRHYKA